MFQTLVARSEHDVLNFRPLEPQLEVSIVRNILTVVL